MENMTPGHSAMEQITGNEAPKFRPMADGVRNKDDMDFKWEEGDAAPHSPRISVETTVRGGVAWHAKTAFTFPEAAAKSLDALTLTRAFGGGLWFLLLMFSLVYSILREGGGNAARAMKDASVIRLSVLAAAIFAGAAILEWDDELSQLGNLSSAAIELSGVLLGAMIIGLLFYAATTLTVLNARLHPMPVRGFRLLGTKAFFSRSTGAELLAGSAAASLVLLIPLALSGVSGLPSFRGYDDTGLLSRSPVLSALFNTSSQEIIAIVALIGVLFPLALRFGSKRLPTMLLMLILAGITFAMLEAPFRGWKTGNLTNALLQGALVVWMYSRFGMLGALSSHASAKLLAAAGAMLVQPSLSLQSSGWAILGSLAALSGLALIAAVKGPEVVTELYGESQVRLQARSRREELLAEFNVARSAQQQMLPAKPPALAGYTLAASCEPAREVGGDLYDFLRLSDGRWGIGVADVSGKGVPAALYMTLTKGLLCAASQESADPRFIMGAVNKHLRTVTKKKMFVTMAFGALDPEARRMEYVRAGHNPAVWRRRSAGETRLLSGGGIGLGIAGTMLFAKTLATEILELEEGDAIVFYSDGLTEAMNEDQEQFGEERLMAAIERADGMHAEATHDSILREVKRFLNGGHSQDDLTIAVLRVSEANNGG